MMGIKDECLELHYQDNETDFSTKINMSINSKGYGYAFRRLAKQLHENNLDYLILDHKHSVLPKPDYSEVSLREKAFIAEMLTDLVNSSNKHND